MALRAETLPSFELAIPPRSVYVGVVRLALSALARVGGLDEDLIDDMKIAVSEACANAVIAAEESGTEEPVRVTINDDGDRFVIEIRDMGAPAAEGASSPAPLDATRTDLSMALIRSLVSDCQQDRTDDGFNLTRLIVTR